jgi:uncharacterized membrane-anchored protein YjiN (DUF445 family)
VDAFATTGDTVSIVSHPVSGTPADAQRAKDLLRIKMVATALFASSVVIAIVARFLEPHHWSLAYLAAWAEAAAVGGLADWYAVVALFRHPCGVPLPHTAIISNNRERIARSFGDFVQEQFLAPEPIAQKLESVDFAALAADWLSDDERSDSLARFALQMTPQALSAIEETGLRAFVAQAMTDRFNEIELAPVAAKLLSSIVDDQRRQRIFDEVLVGLHGLLNDEKTHEAIREKMRRELPTLFNLFRADAYLVRRFVALVSASIEEARAQPDHPLRLEFDHFAHEFIEKLGTSREYAAKAETLKQEFLARPEVRGLGEDLWLSVAAFLQKEAQGENSFPETHLGRFIADLGRKLANEPQLRADINIGVVQVLQTFIQAHKREVARFITDQIRSWDVEQMITIIELNIGRDLQYIRLNGTFIGGLAGLALYSLEHALKLH